MRIFDCILYTGEIDVLLLRLHELHDAVDTFVIVEATRTFSGKAKALYLRAQWERVKSFAAKIRYVVVADDIAEGSASDRERFQRNCMLRGLRDAAPDDLVCASDVDEIPRATVIHQLRTEKPQPVGFKMDVSCFFLNYRNVAGPEAALVGNCAFPRSLLSTYSPDELRHGIRNGSIPARHIECAGWHFSYLSDLEGVERKTSAFSHQEANNLAIPDAIDVDGIVERRGDFFSREDFVWDIVDTNDLPAHVRENPDLYRDHVVCASSLGRRWTRVRRALKRYAFSSKHPKGLLQDRRPMILCPYVRDADQQAAATAFGLHEARGQGLPFYFWKDVNLIGPERAYEHCWNQFPGRDVIIVHTDMRPMPDDLTNEWYKNLCTYVEELPSAGIVGCDLLYPLRSPSGQWYIQCAGGIISNGQVRHIGGGVDLTANAATPEAYEYDERYVAPRPVHWVTFGGVYLRRETIDMVGQFDRRYEWAYWMDVDYCLEAWMRGQDLYQVPVNLLHEESKTSKIFLALPEYANKTAANMDKFKKKWAWYLGGVHA